MSNVQPSSRVTKVCLSRKTLRNIIKIRMLLNSDNMSWQFTWRTTCFPATILLNIHRRGKYFQQVQFMLVTHFLSLTLFEIIINQRKQKVAELWHSVSINFPTCYYYWLFCPTPIGYVRKFCLYKLLGASVAASFVCLTWRGVVLKFDVSLGVQVSDRLVRLPEN
jgi:hypothetical protein